MCTCEMAQQTNHYTTDKGTTFYLCVSNGVYIKTDPKLHIIGTY